MTASRLFTLDYNSSHFPLEVVIVIIIPDTGVVISSFHLQHAHICDAWSTRLVQYLEGIQVHAFVVNRIVPGVASTGLIRD